MSVRVPPAMRQSIQDLAAAEGISESEMIRVLLQRALRRRAAAHASDPLVEVLHAVLPKYFRNLHNLVAAARYDAVIAREMATGAALAALLATGRTEDQARQIVQATLGRAIKTAAKRMQEMPEPMRDGGLTDAASGGEAV